MEPLAVLALKGPVRVIDGGNRFDAYRPGGWDERLGPRGLPSVLVNAARHRAALAALGYDTRVEEMDEGIERVHAALLRRDIVNMVRFLEWDLATVLPDATPAEFAAAGYNGANINRISRAAGFAKGTIYNYFPSKRALMLALIDQIAGSHQRFVAEEVRQDKDPVRRLRCFFQAGLAWIIHNLAQGRVMPAMISAGIRAACTGRTP